MREGGGRGGFQRGEAPEGAGRQAGATRGAAPAAGERQSRPGGAPQGANRTGIATTNATTIDALFAPLPPTEGRGRLWLYVDKKLRLVNVRTGITDGTWVEILDGGDAEQLQPGTEVVTNVITGLEPQARPGQANPGSNPLMGPQRGNQGGRGGPGGAGGGGGRGR